MSSAAFDSDAMGFYGDSRHTVKECTEYARMRRMGESHKLAELLALRVFPATRTDSEFLKGTHEQFSETPQLGDQIQGHCRSART